MPMMVKVCKLVDSKLVKLVQNIIKYHKISMMIMNI